MILTIARRELRGMFLSPLAWTILAVVQLLLALVFVFQLDFYLREQARLVAAQSSSGATFVVGALVLQWAAIIMLMVTPLLTMRLVSEERRSGTLALLMSAPVSMTEIILGKYLGLLLFLLIMLAMIALMPVSLAIGTSPDWGHLAAALLGLALLLAAFAAAGLFVSTLFDQPIVAAVATFGLLLVLWLLGLFEEGTIGWYLSLPKHYEAMMLGVVDTRDVAYFLLFIAAFLALAIRRLDAERLQD